MESRAHVLMLERSSIAASTSTSVATTMSDVQQIPRPLAVRMSSIASSSSSTTVQPNKNPAAPAPSIYQLEDLPVTIDISPATKSCELTARIVSYFFDFEDIATTGGMLYIADNPRQYREEKRVSVNTTGLSFGSSVCIQAEPDSRLLTFVVHADGQHELGVSVTWHGL